MISNILEQEDIVKGMPDQALQQEAQAPSGMLQQFLVISEIKRRTDMRKRHENQMQEQPQGTVAEQILMEGITGIAPQQGVGMPPQMGPQQMPPQGGPQMPPQMPPQGMPPQMPPQGGPMGAPPMQMAAGGIARMANGGTTGMPGENALAGMQAELMARARVLAEATGRSIEEAYQAVLREAQMNMPDYSMIAPAGTGEMPSLQDADAAISSGIQNVYDMIPKSSPDGGMVGRGLDRAGELADRFAYESALQMPNYSALMGPVDTQSAGFDMGMPTRDQAIAADRAGLERIRSKLSPSISSEDIDASVAGMVSERAPRSGGFGGITSLFSGIADRIGELPEELGITGVDRDAKRRARIQSNLEERPIGGSSVTPDMTAAFDLADAQVDALDAADDARLVEMSRTGDASVQGGSKIQTQAKSNPARDFSAMEDFFAELDSGSQITLPNKPGVESAAPVDQALAAAQQVQTDASDPANRLDISDILEESRSMTKANMLMQLGAGIAEGDLSGGLSRAGAAGMKGAQEQRALDMRSRLAEYQAGRQDQERGRKALEFEKTFGLSKRKVDALIEQNADISDRKTMDALIALYENELDEDKRASYAQQIQAMMLRLSGPIQVSGGMQGGTRSREDILNQYLGS